MMHQPRPSFGLYSIDDHDQPRGPDLRFMASMAEFGLRYIMIYRYLYIYQYNVHKNHIFELYYSVFTKITSIFSKAENVFLHSR